MRKRTLLPLLLVLFFTTTGASIIDQETKNGVLDLGQKYSTLSQEVQSHHADVLRRLDETMRLIRGQSDAIDKMTQRLKTLEVREARNAKGPAATGEESAQAAPAAVVVAAEPVAAPAPAAPISDEFKDKIKNSESFSVLAFLFSVISLPFLVLLVVMMRRSEERIRKMIWESEINSIRENVASPQGRPHLKIQTHADGITLLNDGEAAANEIRLYLGPTPSNMKQKTKSITKIQVGEKVEIPLPTSRSDDLLYATLEYKHPNSGRLYKDQFSLKVDRMTGELIPIQQAS